MATVSTMYGQCFNVIFCLCESSRLLQETFQRLCHQHCHPVHRAVRVLSDTRGQKLLHSVLSGRANRPAFLTTAVHTLF